MTLIKKEQNWLDPFSTLADMRTDLDRIFLGSLKNFRDNGISRLFTPDIDLVEDKDKYVVKAELPGMKKEEVEVTLHGNTLVIKGEKKEETEHKDKRFFHTERRYGFFERTVDFASEVEASKIKAVYKDGVMEITLPKSEDSKPKQIKVDVQ